MADPKQALIALMEKNAPETLKRAREAKAARDAAEARREVEKENQANAEPADAVGGVVRDWRARSTAAERSGNRQAVEDVKAERAFTEWGSRRVGGGPPDPEAVVGSAHAAPAAVAMRRAEVARRRAASEQYSRDHGEDIPPERQRSEQYSQPRDPDDAMNMEAYAIMDAESAAWAKAHPGMWRYGTGGRLARRPETKREAEDRALRELEADMARLRERLRGPTLAGAGARKR
jgi:hypothetical protein